MSQQHPETPATGLRARQPTANPPGHKLWRETKPRYKGDAHICCLRLGSASLQLVWGVRGPQRWTVGGTESQLFAGIRGMSLSRVMGAEQGESGLGVGGRAGRRHGWRQRGSCVSSSVYSGVSGMAVPLLARTQSPIGMAAFFLN